MTTETKWCDRDFPHPYHNWIDHSNDEYGISGVYQCPGIVENLTKPLKVDDPAVAKQISELSARIWNKGTSEVNPIDDQRRKELQDWWVTKADDEVGMVASKALEYGGGGAAIDLIEIGRNLVMSGAGGHVNGIHQLPDDARLAELGVYFYLVGKMARWTAAVIEGRQVSDDTLLDIGIYVRMVQRIRDRGAWPGG